MSNLHMLNPDAINFSLLNACFTAMSFMFALFIGIRMRSAIVRPAFMIAILMMIFYQLPFVFYANTFSQEMLDIWWFTMSIYAAVWGNLLWVYFTPQLNSEIIFKPTTLPVIQKYFNNTALYFSVGLFGVLLGIYLYKVPPSCTALYAIFFDPALALLIREMSVKLVGTNISTYALSILSSTVIPIVCFLTWRAMINCFKNKKIFPLTLYFFVLLFAFMTALISGTKGNLIPTFVAMNVASFLSANRWYQRIVVVILLNAMLCSILVGFAKLRPAASLTESGSYPFGACVVKLNACKEVPVLLNSLESHDFSLDLTKSRLHALELETENACHAMGFSTHATNIIHTPAVLTTSEKRIVAEISQETAGNRFKSLINRAFVTPLIVAHWHFLYVKAYGKPGWSGVAIAKKFSKHYIDMPSEICSVYEYIRSQGDKTATCTAPTSYLFTYPAYMGLWGLVLASIATILFDIVGSLLTKYLSEPLNYLAVGLIAVAGINCMTADFTTVLVSHGAGAGFAILIFFYFCRSSITCSTSTHEFP